MNILLRLLWVIIIAGLGGIFYAIVANALVVSGILSGDNIATSFGYQMTQKAVLLWLACVPLAVWAVFMQTKLRYILLLSPLYAPSLFAILYALTRAQAA